MDFTDNVGEDLEEQIYADKLADLEFAMETKDASLFKTAVKSFDFPMNTKFLRSVFNEKFSYLLNKAGYKLITKYNHKKGLRTHNTTSTIKHFKNEKGKAVLIKEKPQDIGRDFYGWYAQTLRELVDENKVNQIAEAKADITRQALPKLAMKKQMLAIAREEYGNQAERYLASLRH